MTKVRGPKAIPAAILLLCASLAAGCLQPSDGPSGKTILPDPSIPREGVPPPLWQVGSQWRYAVERQWLHQGTGAASFSFSGNELYEERLRVVGHEADVALDSGDAALVRSQRVFTDDVAVRLLSVTEGTLASELIEVSLRAPCDATSQVGSCSKPLRLERLGAAEGPEGDRLVWPLRPTAESTDSDVHHRVSLGRHPGFGEVVWVESFGGHLHEEGEDRTGSDWHRILAYSPQKQHIVDYTSWFNWTSWDYEGHALVGHEWFSTTLSAVLLEAHLPEVPDAPWPASTYLEVFGAGSDGAAARPLRIEVESSFLSEVWDVAVPFEAMLQHPSSSAPVAAAETRWELYDVDLDRVAAHTGPVWHGTFPEPGSYLFVAMPPQELGDAPVFKSVGSSLRIDASLECGVDAASPTLRSCTQAFLVPPGDYTIIADLWPPTGLQTESGEGVLVLPDGRQLKGTWVQDGHYSISHFHGMITPPAQAVGDLEHRLEWRPAVADGTPQVPAQLTLRYSGVSGHAEAWQQRMR